MKIATIDLQRLWREYYRAEEAAKQMEARHNALFKALAELRLEGNRLRKEAGELQELSLDPALSASAREEKKKSFDLKLSDLRAFELRYDQARNERETEFQTQALQANKRIAENILSATRGR